MARGAFVGKTALVTGAGSGIGRALALEFARQGAGVAITDINAERLGAVAAELRALGAPTHEYVVDHSSAAAVAELHERFSSEVAVVDVLCLNAGVAVSAEFLDTPIEDWQWAMDLNLWGPVFMLQEFLPDMVARRSGHVMITASLAGLVGLPTTSAYSASKFAVVGLAESLRAEMGPHNIGVSTLCPGVVKTNLLRDGKVALASQGLSAEAANRMWQAVGESPETVARRAIRGICHDRAVIATSLPHVAVPWVAKRLLGGGFSTTVRFAWTQQTRLQDLLRSWQATPTNDPSNEEASVQLRELMEMSGDQLDELYEAAGTPELTEFDGDFEGLLLEGHLPGIGVRFPLSWINQSWLPWKGKAFRDPDADGGKGYNRFQVGSIARGVWNFRTRIAPSQFGGQPACHVDYDVDGNSVLMRRTIFDEVKQLDDGLLLGKGGVHVAGREPFTFYWAIAPAA